MIGVFNGPKTRIVPVNRALRHAWGIDGFGTQTVSIAAHVEIGRTKNLLTSIDMQWFGLIGLVDTNVWPNTPDQLSNTKL